MSNAKMQSRNGDIETEASKIDDDCDVHVTGMAAELNYVTTANKSIPGGDFTIFL